MTTELQMLSDITAKVGRLEGLQDANTRAISDMAASVNKLVDKLDKSDDIAKDADQRARSAHHRIDRIDKILFWAGTSAGAGIIGAVIKFFVDGGLVK